MNDRKMMKWIPFDAVMNSNKIVKELSKKKENIKFPILSDDDYEKIQNDIIISKNNNLFIEIVYYKNNTYIKSINKIKSIDMQKKRIIFYNHSFVNFNQIIKTNII